MASNDEIRGNLSGLDAKTGIAGTRLSGGQRRLLRLAVAMAGFPPVLVLDEPTNDLDPQRRRLVWDVPWITLTTFAYNLLRWRTCICTMQHNREQPSFLVQLAVVVFWLVGRKMDWRRN